jgi:hypothetical protein
MCFRACAVVRKLTMAMENGERLFEVEYEDE